MSIFLLWQTDRILYYEWYNGYREWRRISLNSTEFSWLKVIFLSYQEIMKTVQSASKSCSILDYSFCQKTVPQIIFDSYLISEARAFIDCLTKCYLYNNTVSIYIRFLFQKQLCGIPINANMTSNFQESFTYISFCNTDKPYRMHF